MSGVLEALLSLQEELEQAPAPSVAALPQAVEEATVAPPADRSVDANGDIWLNAPPDPAEINGTRKIYTAPAPGEYFEPMVESLTADQEVHAVGRRKIAVVMADGKQADPIDLGSLQKPRRTVAKGKAAADNSDRVTIKVTLPGASGGVTFPVTCRDVQILPQFVLVFVDVEVAQAFPASSCPDGTRILLPTGELYLVSFVSSGQTAAGATCLTFSRTVNG